MGGSNFDPTDEMQDRQTGEASGVIRMEKLERNPATGWGAIVR